MNKFLNSDRIAPFFWLHGESLDIIKEEIEAIYNCGIRSVCLESRTHEDFCGEGWFSDLRFILQECKKRNMKVWILDDKHFPTGYANGGLHGKNQDKMAWGITESHVDIPGGNDDLALLTEHHIWGDQMLLAAIACRHVPESNLLTGEAIDITDGVSDGLLHFALPEGMWRVFFIKKTRMGIGQSYKEYIDMLNPESVDILIDEVYEKHYANIKEEFGDTFLGFFSDEPAFHNDTAVATGFNTDMGRAFCNYPYSDGVLRNLKEKFGDEAMKLLPGLWTSFDDGREAKIRYAFMDFITDEYRKNFCNRIASWCHERGISYIGHVIEDNRRDATTGYGVGHYFRALDGQDMSGIDVVLTQLVPGMKDCDNAGPVSYRHMNYNFFKFMLAKLGSSMAHLDDKKHGNAMCEIFGAFGWVEGTKTMKWLCDHMLVRGINYFVPHAFSAKENDADCPPIFYYRGKNPQYKYFGKIISYMERSAELLSGGVHKADALIFYDAEFKWMEEGALPLENVAKSLYSRQIDYDIIPTDYLKNVTVKNEKLCINGEKFKLLIVPGSKSISRESAEMLKALKAQSAKIVFVERVPYELENEFECVKASMIADYTAKLGTDVEIDNACDEVHIYHYIKDGRDIYMLTNEGIDKTACFTLKTEKPLGKCALYDALEDKHIEAEKNENGVKITLSPYGSVFLIAEDEGERAPQITSEKELECRYSISLSESVGENYVPYKETDKLFNITGKNEKPRFSGRIKYETHFEHSGKNAMLDLGYVGEIAELKVNGVDLGCKITPPYVFDISSAVREGKNKLEILVTNSNVFALRDRFSTYMRIEPSGLLGPVRVFEYE